MAKKRGIIVVFLQVRGIAEKVFREASVKSNSSLNVCNLVNSALAIYCEGHSFKSELFSFESPRKYFFNKAVFRYHCDMILDYQLFLFDFDGLLVNTEEIHFKAYRNMLANHGCVLNWDFNRYCLAAHYGTDRLREEIYADFPEMKDVPWAPLYAEKKEQLMTLVHEGTGHLMPGVEPLLKSLEGKTSCVVTNSVEEFVSLLREKNPVLNMITHWITRGGYTHPKPHPECYMKAIEQFGKPGEKTIGFEDTPKGIKSLMGTDAKPVMVCTVPYPELPELIDSGVEHFSSLENILGGVV